LLSYTDHINRWYKMFLISIYQWKGPKNVGDVTIANLHQFVFCYYSK
jgi:hypothetical protein